MDTYYSASAVFLIQTVFGLYILAVLLRLMLQFLRADFYNQVSQFLVKITNPPLKPLRRIIPGWGGIDLASVVLLIVLQMAELFLVNVAVGHAVGVGGLFVLAIADLLGLVINVFTGAIILEVILSWMAPGSYSPIIGLVYRIADPVLAPSRRIIPPISGIDLSPLLSLVVLQLMKLLVVAPLSDFGQRLG